ncbi:hypothetical protein [Nitriliruptor alkaliphilus]|uniref:hypothetical protein n=1 Tax=Nitriliruptor alkaliphilus TaxID=427918 RepID=UPI00069768DF|nr:hypothetical protein [Nitriliruptor alkaliphilus]
MASDEDARAAARRIVEQVLADHSAGANGVSPARETDEVEDAPRLEVLVDDAVEDLVADPAADVPEAVSEARARARALVAEVLADHEARTAEAARAVDPEPTPPSAVEVGTAGDDADDADGEIEGAPVAEVSPAATDEEPADGEPFDGEPADDEPADDEPAAEASPESTSRLRARELVAAVLAEAEAREAAAAAAAAEEAEAVRRAEADAEAARAREEEAARELAAALAEETERELWADADRDVATRTQPLQQREGGGEQPVPGADPEADETRPLSVAELAAAGRAARGSDGQVEPDGSPDRTAVIPVVASATVTSREEAAATTAVHRPDDDRPAPAVAEARPAQAEQDTSAPAAEGTAATGVLEATVDPTEVGDPPRTGRWLLASVLGAVTLAILFPLAIRALLDLVSLS